MIVHQVVLYVGNARVSVVNWADEFEISIGTGRETLTSVAPLSRSTIEIVDRIASQLGNPMPQITDASEGKRFREWYLSVEKLVSAIDLLR